MYTLVLTLLIMGGSKPAVAITHIDGFSSENACLTAGNAVLSQHKGMADRYTEVKPRAMCIRKSN